MCNGKKWRVKGIDLNGDYFDLENVKTHEILTDNYFLNEIAEMNFED
ncbi:hypothetical protein [Clostridium sporogenes]